MKKAENIATPKPTDPALLERALSLCNQEIFTVHLQFRRLHTDEPEDRSFVFRKWADFQFFIVALQRLRRSALIAANVQAVSSLIERGIKAFDKALPGLIAMRNVSEHIDEYAIDRGRNTDIFRSQLQVSTQEGNTFYWLGHTINITGAVKAAEDLFIVVRDAVKQNSNREPLVKGDK